MNVGGYNFSSSMAIAAWAQSRETQETDQMQQLMNNSDQEAAFSQALTKLQGDIKSAVDIHDYGKVAKEINDFLAEYKSDPRYEALKEMLQPMADRLNQAQAKHDGTPLTIADGLITFRGIPDVKGAAAMITSDVAEGWNSDLQSFVDSASQDSKFVMLQVQDLQSQANQAMDAASALIKNGNDTLDAIIRNF